MYDVVEELKTTIPLNEGQLNQIRTGETLCVEVVSYYGVIEGEGANFEKTDEGWLHVNQITKQHTYYSTEYVIKYMELLYNELKFPHRWLRIEIVTSWTPVKRIRYIPNKSKQLCGFYCHYTPRHT